MTDKYVGPEPESADYIARSNAECDQAYERLKQASVTQLKQVFRDRRESDTTRFTAFAELMRERDPELDDLALELFDDHDRQLWQSTITSYISKDPRILGKLKTILDHSDDDVWSSAAVALARAGDETLIPCLTGWLDSGDEDHRNVAIESLKMLRRPSATAVLRDAWDQGVPDEETRWVIAAALLDRGDSSGRPLLESMARLATGPSSVAAATSIYCNDAREGLKLMLQILQEGDLEAKQSMVNQIWSFAHLPHAFTADGLAEAQLWVQKQLDGELVDRFAFPS